MVTALWTQFAMSAILEPGRQDAGDPEHAIRDADSGGRPCRPAVQSTARRPSCPPDPEQPPRRGRSRHRNHGRRAGEDRADRRALIAADVPAVEAARRRRREVGGRGDELTTAHRRSTVLKRRPLHHGRSPRRAACWPPPNDGPSGSGGGTGRPFLPLGSFSLFQTHHDPPSEFW